MEYSGLEPEKKRILLAEPAVWPFNESLPEDIQGITQDPSMPAGPWLLTLKNPVRREDVGSTNVSKFKIPSAKLALSLQ